MTIPVIPKISIITLSFNQHRFLVENIISTTSQDFSDFEQIIIDPGSTDGSRDYIISSAEKYQNIRYIFESDNGPADGLSKGFRRAKGSLVICLNSDDYLTPGALRSIWNAHAKYPSKSVITSHGLVRNETTNSIKFQFTDKVNIKAFAENRCLVFHPCTVYVKRFLDKNQIEVNTSNKTCWDYEIIKDILNAGGSFKRFNAVWAVFRLHHESISGSGRLNDQYTHDIYNIIDDFRFENFVKSSKTLSTIRVTWVRVKRKFLSVIFRKLYI